MTPIVTQSQSFDQSTLSVDVKMKELKIIKCHFELSLTILIFLMNLCFTYDSHSLLLYEHVTGET